MKKEIKVSGHLEVIKGVYHMKLSWVSEDGKRHRRSKSTGLIERGNKKRAYDMLIDFIREQEAELAAKGSSAKDILFADYMKQWLERVKMQIRLTTYSGYQDNVNGVIVPYFEPMGLKLSEVTPQHIQNFYTEQLKRVKGTTVKSYHANIHKAFKDARRLQLIDSNPMDCVDPPKTTPFHGQAYTVEEAQKILTLVNDTIFEIPVTVMLFYGLRREEAIGLKWSNIDFDNDSLLIGHTVTETKVDGHLQVVKEDLTKNSSSYRTLPLVAPIKALLEKKKKSICEYRKLFKKGYCHEDSDYVCVNEIGELIRPRTLSDNFKRIIKKNNIRKKVLLIDCDAQGSLTESLGYQNPDELDVTLSTLMQKTYEEKEIKPGEGILHHNEGVDLVPANIELSGMETALVNIMSRERVLKNYIDSYRHKLHKCK